ncbi:MAG: phosphoribosyltransferase family protein [Akkermansia sp.]|nr:phosphoribosyltransferase family protein [Akkermansia sp.]
MGAIGASEISAAICGWTERIAAAAEESSERLAVIGLISHGDLLAQRLVAGLKARGIDALYGAIDISLYRDDADMRAEKLPLRSSYLPFSTDGLHVILVDDVLYTGRTIRAALNALFEYGRPARVELQTLADRGGREVPICADYTCFHIEPEDGREVRVRLVETDGEDKIEF